MFFVSFYMSMKVGATYEQSTTFPLPPPRIISNWPLPWPWPFSGFNPAQAFAAVIGPLVEVPVLISLVNVALWFKRKYFPYAVETPTGVCHVTCKP